MRKNAKRAKVLIEAERFNPNMEFLRICHVLKRNFKEVFGEHWKLLFLRVQYQEKKYSISEKSAIYN